MAVSEVGPIPITDEDLATDLMLIAILRESPVLTRADKRILADWCMRIDDLLSVREFVSGIMAQLDSIPEQRIGLWPASAHKPTQRQTS